MKDKAYIYKFNLVAANIFSIVILVVMAVLTFIIRNNIDFSFPPKLLLYLLIYLCVHELLHGIGYIIGGAKPKNIYFGAALEKGILYCLCRQEVKKKSILISLQMPFTVIGVITYVIGLLINDYNLIILSVCNLVGASMDMMMFFYIMKIKNVRYSETDANDEFVLITSEDLSKKKSMFFNLKETKPYKKEDYIFKKKKRVEISKISWILLLLLIIISVLPYVL